MSWIFEVFHGYPPGYVNKNGDLRHLYAAEAAL